MLLVVLSLGLNLKKVCIFFHDLWHIFQPVYACDWENETLGWILLCLCWRIMILWELLLMTCVAVTNQCCCLILSLFSFLKSVLSCLLVFVDLPCFVFFCFVYFETDLFQRIYLNYLKFINKEMIKRLFSLCALELHLLCMSTTVALTVINNSWFLCCWLSNSTGCSLSHRLLNTANFCKIFLLGYVRLYLGEKKNHTFLIKK